MKNTFLKKAVATALAAVMAVTFAPVASLNAFAKQVGVDGEDEIGSAATAIVTKGGVEYTVRTDGDVKIQLDLDKMNGTYTFNVEKAAKATFDFNGAVDTAHKKSVTVKINGEPKATSTAKGVKVEIPTVDFDEDDVTDYSKFGVSLSGNMILAKEENVNNNINIVDGLKSNPVAQITNADGTALAKTEGTELYLGNAAIDTVQQIITDPVRVVAYNGAVEVSKLKSGSSATVNDWVYNYGTSIKATAAAKVALAKVSTTLSYKYVVKDGAKTTVELPGEYVEDAYYVGYSKINEGVHDTPVPCNRTESTTGDITISVKDTTTGITRTGSAVAFNYFVINANKLLDDETAKKLNNYYSNLTAKYDAERGRIWVFGDNESVGTLNWADTASYTQAITIDQNGEDWTGKYLDAYLNDVTKAGTGVKGITYYVADPSSFTKSEDGVALIDGAKYVVSDHTQPVNELKYAGSKVAQKSVAILRGTEIKATAGNDYAYENFDTTSTDLAVTAPADMSLVKETANTVTGRYKDVVYSWRAFGSLRHSAPGMTEQEYDFPYKDPAQKKVDNNIYVAQVASGSTMTVYIDPRVGVTKADKLGYFTTDTFKAQKGNNIVGDDWKAVTFGEVAPVTKKFTSTVAGLKTEANLYASKEIKTTLKGVDPDVVITGEINADVIDTAADGTKTWDVNTNAAKAASQVTAYRMYRKSGEHVYTINPAEVTMLENAGWINEGKAFTVNSVASGKGTPIYRLYNKNGGGMHFYTASAAEKDMLLANGWTEGKVVFYGADKATGIPVYRTYNTGSNNGEHNYTTNIAESEMNVQKGWRSEGVAFYVFK